MTGLYEIIKIFAHATLITVFALGGAIGWYYMIKDYLSKRDMYDNSEDQKSNDNTQEITHDIK